MTDTETTPWTDEAKAYLAELMQHRPPLNYSAIADRMVSRFHRVFTKNSCISRARRGTGKKQRASSPHKKKRKPYRHPAAKPEPPKPGVTWGKVTIMQLTSHTCRWPVTEGLPPYFYCGIPPVEGSVYCFKHSRIAYPAMGRH